MMKKAFLFLLVIILLITIGLIAFFYSPRAKEDALERILNQNLHEYFNGSLRLNHVKINSKLQLEIDNLTGDFQADSGIIPVEVRKITSVEPISDALLLKTTRFRFEDAKPSRSLYDGVDGYVDIKLGPEWSFKMEGDIQGVGLEDLTALNPDTLMGSSGQILGKITVSSDSKQDPVFGLEIRVDEPGGSLQARFFDTLRPYLPQLESEPQLKELTATGQLVAYRKATFNLNLSESDRMKVFLHIEVPEYNLNLNLNMEIRVDKKNAFLQIAQLMGLIKVGVA